MYSSVCTPEEDIKSQNDTNFNTFHSYPSDQNVDLYKPEVKIKVKSEKKSSNKKKQIKEKHRVFVKKIDFISSFNEKDKAQLISNLTPYDTPVLNLEQSLNMFKYLLSRNHWN